MKLVRYNSCYTLDLCTEIAAAMSDSDVPFSVKTLAAAPQMQQAKQQAQTAAIKPLAQNPVQFQSMGPWPQGIRKDGISME